MAGSGHKFSFLPPRRPAPVRIRREPVRSATERGGCSAISFTPIWRGGVDAVSDQSLLLYNRALARLEQLQEVNRQLAAQASAANELYRENADLRRLLNLPVRLRRGGNHPVRPAAVERTVHHQPRETGGDRPWRRGPDRHAGRASVSGRRNRPGRRTLRRRHHALQPEPADLRALPRHRGNRHHQPGGAPPDAGQHSGSAICRPSTAIRCTKWRFPPVLKRTFPAESKLGNSVTWRRAPSRFSTP